MTADEYAAFVESRGRRTKRVRGGWEVECPAHDSVSGSSLSVKDGDKGLLLHCFGGCSFDEIVAADGLDAAELFHERRAGRPELVATYTYVDEQGAPLYEVGRFEPGFDPGEAKSFLQRRPGRSDWKGGIKGVRRVLYRLSAVLAAVEAGQTIWLAEGEKDVHALERAGAVATTNSGGAEQWRREYAETLRGGDVVVVQDRDDAGRKRGARVAADLTDVAASVRVVEAVEGKDAADHLRAGKTLEEFVPVKPQSTADDLGLSFVWASELRDLTPEEPPWLLAGYIARGAITMAAGKPKAGKSTWAWAVADAVSANVPSFLGRAVDGGPVVYLSEEGPGTLRDKLPSGCIRVLTRDSAWPKPAWPELVRAAVAEAQRIDAKLLVVDALSFWAGFAENQEKDAGAAQAVMDALLVATGAGLAVLVVHHQRKAGGEDGDAVRGSGALFGAVDVLVEVERAGEGTPPTQRRLVTVGRWPAPPVLVVDSDPATGAWGVIGESADRTEAAALGAREKLLNALPATTPGATEDELAKLVHIDKRKISRPLRELVDEDLVTRSGGGRRGDPYRYSRAQKVSAPETAPAGGRNGHSDSAPPRRGAASSSDSASCPGAETGGTLGGRTDEDMQALIDTDRAGTLATTAPRRNGHNPHADDQFIDWSTV